MKLWERVIDQRLRLEIHVHKINLVSSCWTDMEAIYFLRRLIVRYQRNQNLHMVFIDLKMPYRKVPTQRGFVEFFREKRCLDCIYSNYQRYLWRGHIWCKYKIEIQKDISITKGVDQESIWACISFIMVLDVLT